MVRDIEIIIESTGKKIPIIKIDSSVIMEELLFALKEKINLPQNTQGILIRKKNRQTLKADQSLASAGIEDGETFIADFERTAGGDGKVEANLEAISEATINIAGSNIRQSNPYSILFGDEIGKKSQVYPSFSQEFIITTADKLRLSLIEFQEASKSKTDWLTPFGILLALISTLVAADFRNFLGVDSETWQSSFIVGSIVCFIWLLHAIYKAIRHRKKSDINYVIQTVKQSSNSNKSE